jgi:hypothetical protein
MISTITRCFFNHINWGFLPILSLALLLRFHLFPLPLISVKHHAFYSLGFLQGSPLPLKKHIAGFRRRLGCGIASLGCLTTATGGQKCKTGN